MSNHRELTGDHYHLAIVERTVSAPPFVDDMLRVLFDEMGAQGNFTFHPRGPLDPHLQKGDVRISSKLDGDEILMSLRFDEGPDKSIRGSLYVPSGKKPAEVQKEIQKRLSYLNNNWSDYLNVPTASAIEIAPQSVAVTNGELKAAESLRPISSEKPVAPPPATIVPKPKAAVGPLQTPAATAAPVQATKDDDDTLAQRLLTRAHDNALLPYHCLRYYLPSHTEESPNFVIKTIKRLEEKGVLRRVRAVPGEWQFTESFVKAHAPELLVEYEALPEVTLHQGRSRVPLKRAPPTKKEATRKKRTVDPCVSRLKVLYANLDRVKGERRQIAAQLQVVQAALTELDTKMAAVEAEIASAQASLSQKDLLKLVLHRDIL